MGKPKKKIISLISPHKLSCPIMVEYETGNWTQIRVLLVLGKEEGQQDWGCAHVRFKCKYYQC